MTELDTLYSIYARSASEVREPVLPYADWLAETAAADDREEVTLQDLIDWAEGKLEARQ